MNTPIPDNEPERLAELYRHEILDTLPEGVWDDLTLLATHICDTPIAAISFVDYNRQWFKSIQGLDTRQTERNVAFCSHTILKDAPLIVEDALGDERFVDNALVTGEPHIRFYAGAPIVSERGHALGSFCVIDQKPRQLSEAQLSALQALARQVSELLRLKTQHKALTSSRQEALKLASIRKEILSNTSHEIRTPLNAVLGYTQLLGRTSLDDQQQEYLQRLSRSSRHMLEVVNGILDLSKIEAGELLLEQKLFPLENILEKLRDILALSAEQKGLELLFDISPTVPAVLWGDPLRLEQVLLNLLGNAIKFTPEGHVALKITYEKAADAEVTLCHFHISDTGIGIEKAQIERIFEPYSQAELSISHKFGGTGLGLAISKELVQLMGGHLEVDTTPGEGSTFSFALPMLNTYLPPPNPTTLLPKTRVLLIEDHSEMLRLLTLYLEHLNCQVTAFKVPQEALNHAANTPNFGEAYEVILLDGSMRQHNSFEILEQLKAYLATGKPRIVLMVPYGHSASARAEQHAQVDYVLHKPITLSKLHNHLLEQTENVLEHLPLKSLPEFQGRVLVAEDHEVNQHIIRELLSQMALDFDVVDNGKEAVTQATTQAYDLVLMDLHMPVMDGLEASQRIREEKADLPIVVLTADVLNKVERRAHDVGIQHVLAKPLQLDAFLEVLHKYLASCKPEAPAAQEPAEPLEAPEAPDHMIKNRMETLDAADDFFDFATARERLLDNMSLFKRLFRRFLTEDALAELKTLEGEAYRDKLHSLKGLSGNLGFAGLFEACSILQKEEGPPQESPAFAQFVQAYERTAKTLRALLGEDIATEAESTLQEKSAFYAQLLELSLSLSRYDMQAEDQVQVLHHAHEDIPAIVQAIKRFDYPTAHRLTLNVLKRVEHTLGAQVF